MGKITAIVAVDKNWGIGKDGKLLAHIPGDLRYFKEKTLGKTVLFGRKTFESLPGSKPLPGRRNVILTRDANYSADCDIVHSIDEFLDKYGSSAGAGDDEVFIAGGADVYKTMLGCCHTCLVTKLDEVFDADSYFPDLDKDPDFTMIFESDPISENGTTYRFTEYGRSTMSEGQI